MFRIMSADKYKKVINRDYSKLVYWITYAKTYSQISRELKRASIDKLFIINIRIGIRHSFSDHKLIYDVCRALATKLDRLGYVVTLRESSYSVKSFLNFEIRLEDENKAMTKRQSLR